MMKLLLAALALLLTIGAASAQNQTVRLCTGNPCVAVDNSNPLPTAGGGGGGTASQIQGNSASGAADIGNPVKVGGKFNAALPTFTDGQRGDVQIDVSGRTIVNFGSGAVAAADAITNTASARVLNGTNPGTGTQLQLETRSYLLNTAGTWDRARSMPTADAQAVTGFTGTGTMLFNGSGYDRQRSIPGAGAGTGIGVSAVGIVPTSATSNGITPVVSTAAESGHVLKASAGNLYSVYATNLTATAGFLVVLNSTTVPADGAITPLECTPLPANGTAAINYNPGPVAVFSTGITAVITSATTCFTKTTGVITGFIKGAVQ